jgi:hypothetical protein
MNKNKNWSILVFIFLMACQGVSYAWWEAGHMIVSNIAYHHLNTQAKKEVIRLLPFMAVESTTRKDYSFNSKQPNYTVMAMSHWPDDLNAYPNYLKTMKTWHYIQHPYTDDGTPLPAFIPRDNVVWAISQLRNHLHQKKGNDYDKVRSLAALIHFVGDIHQPLHCAEYHSQDLPNGDRGGNEYKLYFKEPNGDVIYNLHMLWDSALQLYTDKGYSHNVDSLKDIDAITKEIMNDYPEVTFGSKSKIIDPEAWEAESHALAKDAHDLPFKGKPSEAYLKENTVIAEQQMALAGYRLAHVLNEILG